jgi:hypothetical protein
MSNNRFFPGVSKKREDEKSKTRLKVSDPAVTLCEKVGLLNTEVK